MMCLNSCDAFLLPAIGFRWRAFSWIERLQRVCRNRNNSIVSGGGLPNRKVEVVIGGMSRRLPRSGRPMNNDYRARLSKDCGAKGSCREISFVRPDHRRPGSSRCRVYLFNGTVLCEQNPDISTCLRACRRHLRTSGMQPNSSATGSTSGGISGIASAAPSKEPITRT